MYRFRQGRAKPALVPNKKGPADRRALSLTKNRQLTTDNYFVRPASIFNSALAPACAAANRAVSTRKGEQET